MKKPIKVMGLGVVKGDVVKVTVTGDDEEEAAEAIRQAFIDNKLA